MDLKIKKLLMALAAGLFFSFTYLVQNDEWTVPESAAKLKNPITDDSEVASVGKSLYAKHCKSCHGKSGEGDGPKSKELDDFPGDFTLDEFKEQTDGAKEGHVVPLCTVVHSPGGWQKIAMQAGNDNNEALEPHTDVDEHADHPEPQR